MSARAAILAALSGGGAPAPGAAAALSAALEHPPQGCGPAADLFLRNVEQGPTGATAEAIADWGRLPATIAVRIGLWGLTPTLYLPPDPRLAALDWPGVERLARCPIDDGVALAVAVAAVAETGTVVLDTAPEAPMLPNFLALHHLVAVERSAIVRWLEDLPSPATLPRQRSWVTGVSGTTDIEGEYVRGAHGPRHLHLIVIG